MTEAKRPSFGPWERRMDLASCVWAPIALLCLFAVTAHGRELSPFPHSFVRAPAYWQLTPSLWVVLSLYLTGMLGPALCYCAAGARWLYALSNVAVALAISCLAFMMLRGGYGVWGDMVLLRDPAPWVKDVVVRAPRVAGLTTGCFEGTSAKNPDHLEFTIRWWSSPGEVAQRDLAGYQLNVKEMPNWLAAIYPYYRLIPSQTIAARFQDSTRIGCVKRLSSGLEATQAAKIRALLGLPPAG